MRRFALLSLLALAACPGPITLKKLGEACMEDGDCGSMMCKEGVCARPCANQGECPEGFDCGLAKPADTMSVCYAAKYERPAKGGFGTDCSTVAKGCSADPSPCAPGFECRAELKCDPAAYCTTSCAADVDCPHDMFCGEEKAGRTCIKRATCASCFLDDQCPNAYKCITDSRGGRHCAKTCAATSDCHQPLNGAQYFEKCLPDAGGKGNVCLPAIGYCKGPSPLQALAGMGDGQICSPCRIGMMTDCAESVRSAGGGCFEEKFSSERFCTVPCTLTISNTGRVANDTCPSDTYCAIGAVGMPGTYKGICSGDFSYSGPTCYP